MKNNPDLYIQADVTSCYSWFPYLQSFHRFFRSKKPPSAAPSHFDSLLKGRGHFESSIFHLFYHYFFFEGKMHLYFLKLTNTSLAVTKFF